MSDNDSQFLDTFPNWLRSLGEDAEAMGGVLKQGGCSEGARRVVAGGLNYLFKSLDLIPDGIDDIGYLDDAFVLRVSADLARSQNLEGLDAETRAQIDRLADDCTVLSDFLQWDYDRLRKYVEGLHTGAAHGRSVGEIVKDSVVCDALLEDLAGFASEYACPSFAQEQKSLIKLRAFFDAKLPK